MDDEEIRVIYFIRQKFCCCLNYDIDFIRIYRDFIRFNFKGSRGYSLFIFERFVYVGVECSDGSLNDEIVDKFSLSDYFYFQFGYRLVQYTRIVFEESNFFLAMLREEEFFDVMLLLYYIGVVLNFKQVWFCFVRIEFLLFIKREVMVFGR